MKNRISRAEARRLAKWYAGIVYDLSMACELRPQARGLLEARRLALTKREYYAALAAGRTT